MRVSTSVPDVPLTDADLRALGEGDVLQLTTKDVAPGVFGTEGTSGVLAPAQGVFGRPRRSRSVNKDDPNEPRDVRKGEDYGADSRSWAGTPGPRIGDPEYLWTSGGVGTWRKVDGDRWVWEADWEVRKDGPEDEPRDERGKWTSGGYDEAMTSAAVDKLGVTDYFPDAGFVLPDGRLLDLKRTRQEVFIDHESVSVGEFSVGAKSLTDFMRRTGAVRLVQFPNEHEGPLYASAERMPTDAQVRSLVREARTRRANLLVLETGIAHSRDFVRPDVPTVTTWLEEWFRARKSGDGDSTVQSPALASRTFEVGDLVDGEWAPNRDRVSPYEALLLKADEVCEPVRVSEAEALAGEVLVASRATTEAVGKVGDAVAEYTRLAAAAAESAAAGMGVLAKRIGEPMAKSAESQERTAEVLAAVAERVERAAAAVGEAAGAIAAAAAKPPRRVRKTVVRDANNRIAEVIEEEL